MKDFVKREGLTRPRDVKRAGFPTYLLYRLRDRGELVQIGPGLFKHPESDISGKHSYAAAVERVPHGVICLASALAFHEIGVQLPRKVWIALNRAEIRTRPRIHEPPLEFVWFSGAAFEEGQEKHKIEGVNVRVYSPAKTVADLFKYRNKIGKDVTIEGLREGWKERLFTMDQVEHYADVCGVSNVMQPYLEALVSTP